MRICLSILLALACCQASLAQVFENDLQVSQFSAITAKSAAIEPLSERVAVFLTDRDAGEKLGIEVVFTTTAKFAAVRIADSQFRQQSVVKSSLRPNTWLMFGQPGRYFITVIESDPELGLGFVDSEFTITGDSQGNPPDEPTKPVPDIMSELVKVADQMADAMDDETTRAKLATGYKTASAAMIGKPYAEAVALVKAARFQVLNARRGRSLAVPWDEWLLAVDGELQKVVTAGDVDKYAQAIDAVVIGLEN